MSRKHYWICCFGITCITICTIMRRSFGQRLNDLILIQTNRFSNVWNFWHWFCPATEWFNLPYMFALVVQLCRYLYYLGKIRTIQLEYTDAKECLLQAARKAPASARGFRIQCTKWAVIVRLLLGEIPERTTFMQPGMRKALRPYFELTNVSISTNSLCAIRILRAAIQGFLL